VHTFHAPVLASSRFGYKPRPSPNVLEWRCDPTSEAELPEAVGDDVEWVIVCSEGSPPASAVAALLDIGLLRAADVIGGYQALLDAGVSGQRSPQVRETLPRAPWRPPTPPLAAGSSRRQHHRPGCHTSHSSSRRCLHPPVEPVPSETVASEAVAAVACRWLDPLAAAPAAHRSELAYSACHRAPHTPRH
jgi:hypothetical protein